LILLDTCTLIFAALTADRLSANALRAIEDGETNGTLVCADISLWEIAMLVSKGRLDPGIDSTAFCRLMLDARGIRVLPITPEIATDAVRIEIPQADPADRLIAATARAHRAPLVTADERLRESTAVETIW
jgi:PIN domain nuclease of toxin-antitoxin system